jgi:hypothetical protein
MAASRQFLVRRRISAATTIPTPMMDPVLPKSDQTSVRSFQPSVRDPSNFRLIDSSPV